MNATDDSESDDPSSSASYTTMPSYLDLPTTYAVQDILTTLAPILKRLVIDMPLRSIRPEWDHMGIKPHLRRAFEALVNIEEFVSIRDELYLATIDEIPHTEPEVWAECWPKLRRVALYNPCLEGDYWHSMAQPPDLELFVGTRPDPPAEFFHDYNITEKWHNAARQTRTPQEFTLTVVDCVPEILEFVALTARWERPDPPNSVHVRAVGVIPPTEKDDYDEKHDNVWAWTGDPIAATQHWIKKQALKGTLWDEARKGTEVTGIQEPTT
ncbi:hypothetical protein FDECE_7708 [Fusarium decemcellulare]|nr:hypothetical protein FDECE_7708 [Fusarium decemcellulare]